MGLYKDNKKAKVHSIIKCPVCHKKFEKIQYSQSFCCGQCKDRFWNNKGDRHTSPSVSESRRYPFSYDGADDDQWGDCDFGIHE